MIRVILLLTIFFTPLLSVTPKLGYEQIKVLFFIGGVSLASIFWLRKNWGKKYKGSPLSKAGVVFIATLLVSSLMGTDPKISILGAPPYFQGLILYAYFFLFFILIRTSRISFDIWVKVLIGSASVVSFIAIRQYVEINLLGLSIPTYAGRVVSSFGQPNFYAGFLLLVLPFALAKRWWLSIPLIIGILISESRAGILLMFGLMVFWFVNKFTDSKKILSLIFAVLILLFVGFVTGQVWEDIYQKEFTEIQDNEWLFQNSPEKRIFIYPIIGQLILQRPLLGYGLENMSGAFTGFFNDINFNTNSNPLYLSLKDLIVDRGHNYILDLLFFSGILGLIGYLGLVGTLLKKAKGVVLISLILYLIWIQFQNQSVVHLLYFWLLVGLIDQSST